MEKKIQIAIVLTVLAAAIVAAVYLFTQSRKIEGIDKQGGPTVEDGGNQTTVAAEDRLRGQAQNATRQAEGNQTAPSESDNATAEPAEAGTEEPAGEAAQNKTGDRPDTSLARSMVTPRFVDDLADFVLSRYHPPQSVDNPKPQGKTTIDFKSLNARYGLELIGLRTSSSNLRKAREEVLTVVMDPDVLEFLYNQYADSFVDELVATAREVEKPFVSPEGMRGLETEHIAEMLRLNAEYIGNVAEVFEILGQSKAIPGMVDSYIEAEKEAVHANYILNQKQNELARLEQRLEEAKEDTDRLQLRVKNMQEEKELAALEYKQAIQHREKIRQKLLQTIRNQAGQLDLETHEVLYIAEWVHRRISEGENSPAILVGAEVLDGLAGKLRSRAGALADG